MFSSRSIIFVVFSAVLLSSGAYGQDDCDDPQTYLANMAISLQNIQNMGQTVIDQFPAISQTVKDSVMAAFNSDDVQGPISDTVASLSDLLGNMDDMKSIADQTMGQLQETVQSVMTNPMVGDVLNDFAGNMNDMVKNGMTVLQTMGGKMGDLGGDLSDTGSGLVTFFTGPDMTDNMKDLADNGINYVDTMINQAVSGGVSNIIGMLNDGLSNLPDMDGLSNMPDMSTLLSGLPMPDISSMLGGDAGSPGGDLNLPGGDAGSPDIVSPGGDAGSPGGNLDLPGGDAVPSGGDAVPSGAIV